MNDDQARAEVFEFGIGKYVYATAYDRERAARVRAEADLIAAFAREAGLREALEQAAQSLNKIGAFTSYRKARAALSTPAPNPQENKP